jgi:DNA-binding PadR family transcriptional regulator
MVRYALLGLLKEQPDYGYRLKLRFDERVGTAWHLNIGQVYQTLRALQRSKLIAEVAGTSDGQHPARRMFELTAKGQRVLDRWMQRPPVRLRPVRDEMLIRLLVVEPSRRGELLARLEEQEHHYKRHMARLVMQHRRSADADEPEHLIRTLSVEAAMLHTEAHLKWLEYTRERLLAVTGEATGPVVDVRPAAELDELAVFDDAPLAATA